jgi:ABC-2 type transport system permease protein
MRNVSALTRRELHAWFVSPMAYVVLTVFVIVPGYIFYEFAVTRLRTASLEQVVNYMSYVLLFISPMLTMRLFAEEFQSGTIETLMTAPVTTLEVVLSKYLATLLFLVAMLVPTFAYGAALFALGEPDPGLMVARYFGLFLLGAHFLGVGMVVSACMRRQVSAAIVTVVLLMVLQTLHFIVPQNALSFAARALRYTSYFGHFYNSFMEGFVDTRDLVFFVSTSVFCVFLTALVVTVRRWS